MEGAVLSGKLTAQAIAKAKSEANSPSLQMTNFQPATNAATA
jgi:15-cis-phytoene desaturase